MLYVGHVSSDGFVVMLLSPHASTIQVTASPIRALLGAALEVHLRLGPGFLEQVYQEALAVEFGLRGIPFRREVHVPVFYKGKRLTTAYRADFICHEAFVIELKVVQQLSGRDDRQLKNYLHTTRLHHGLLLNFGVDRLQYKQLLGVFGT